MQLFEKTSEIAEVLGMFGQQDPPVKLLEYLEVKLIEMMETIQTSDFLYTGSIALALLRTERLAGFPSFLLRKHQDYGIEPLMISRTMGMVDRMLHKVARIKNLQRRDGDQTQHIQEEIQDLLGYSVIGYLFIQKYGV